MKWFLLTIFLFLFCSSTKVLSWDVMYVAGERERDKFIAQLKEKKFKYVIMDKRVEVEDIYEIRFKEEKK
jgi:hypothetical protein